MLAWAEDGAKRLLDLEDTDGQIAELESRRATHRGELGDLPARSARRQAARRLGAAVGDELTSLAMPHATVTIANPGHAEPGDADRPQLLWTVVGCVPGARHRRRRVPPRRTGAEARPLHKGASGGELSRVMLALEVSLAETGSVPTFVFDEVDAGVGGKAAIEVGRRLAALARTSQVLVVTHLPAGRGLRRPARGRAQVERRTVTTSGLVSLTDDDRERELSRMLAGVEDSDSARAMPASCSRPLRPSGRASPRGPPAADTMARSRSSSPLQPPPSPVCTVPPGVHRRTASVLGRLHEATSPSSTTSTWTAPPPSLVDAGVVAVVNASPMISGRYPNLGSELLVDAGLTVVDSVGPGSSTGSATAGAAGRPKGRGAHGRRWSPRAGS